MKQLEILIEPHSSSMRYYVVRYRNKKKYNIFNSWRTLHEVWDGVYLTYDHPILFENFEEAIVYGKKLKNNPKRIRDHYKKQDEIYLKAKKRRKGYKQLRNKSEII